MKKLLYLFLLLPFIANAQNITSISPNSGEQGQVITVSISGQNTVFQQGTNTVKLYKSGTTIFATSTTVTSPTSISATFSFNAGHPTGVYDVIVANYTPTTSLTLSSCFTLYASGNSPYILGISPNTAMQGQTLSVSITGQNTAFQQGTNFVKLYQNGTAILIVSGSATNDTLIHATFAFTTSHPPGVYDLVVTNSYSGSTLTLASGFTLTSSNGPLLLAMSPTTAIQGDTVTALITGRNTHFSTAPDSAWLTNGPVTINPLLINVINDTALTAKFGFSSTSLLGYYSAHVSNATDGIMLKSATLLLTGGPQSATLLKSVNPGSAVQGQTLSVSITGQNTVFQQGTNTIKLYRSGTTINPVSASVVTNDTLISATFSFTGAHPAGLYDVIVDHYFGSTLTLNDGFMLYSPATVAITGVSPASATQGNSLTLSVTGLNTHFGSGDLLWLQDIYGDTISPAAITVTDSISIQAQFNFTTSHLPGSYKLSEANITDGILFLDDAFELYPGQGAPAIVNVSPNAAGINQTVMISFEGSGTHFTTGLDTMSLVNSLYRSTTYIYPSSVTVINDSLIQGTFDLTGVDGGDYDILIQGSENIRLANGFVVWDPVSVNEIIAEKGISIFPNPAHGVFYIKIDKSLEDGELTVIDLQGKVLLSRKNVKASEEVDLSLFPKGMYFVKLIKEDQIKTGKIIRQ